ncbi:hypothetical protein JRO89_XS01G0002900 [Xanthoceras sorbifolium]|uniref:Fatty acid hydroxylase domain-containing protein n=1 Tax=Xanthoceras sorbifolium TaxID=99658 RepID=A0ABQ8IHJ0_9ROSI|nr:hypothetical protein JRO89_XS01G0002900 [Xanthoceras sorbifolium]
METSRQLQVPGIGTMGASQILHNQIWITLSRYRTSKGNNLIVDKSIDFDQVDRESNWDDQIILHTMLSYLISMSMARAHRLPFWRSDGVIMTILLHMGPVEFLYYWFHRALHHHYLYSRYHSHHHSSIVTQPISAFIHPFAEIVVYFMLFGIPVITTILTGTASMAVVFGYLTYIDFMNNMGHCNFELIPEWLFSIFPPLKYLMYTPSIPPGTAQVVLRGKLSKVARAIAFGLCQRGIQIWLVGEGLTDEEQNKASKGTIFIPFSQFPPMKIRKDCFYHTTPAMITPPSLHNLHSCENWLPRRVMSAWRVARIVHGMEEWNVNECGESIFNIDQVWEATLHRGFRPLCVSS